MTGTQGWWLIVELGVLAAAAVIRLFPRPVTATHTGVKLHRLAGQIAKLPDAGMITVAKTGKQIIEAEARAAGVGTMRIAGKGRGARQSGPTKARRTVRLRAKDTFKPGTGASSLRLQAVPVGPWVWANTGTDGHWVGRAKGKSAGRGKAGPARQVGAWVRGKGYAHGVRGPVLHPGTRGRGAWRKAATRVTAAVTVTFHDELHDLVKGFSMAANEQVNLDLTATDKASDKVDDLADKVEELEKHPAEVEVTADTSKATRGLDDLTGDAKRLAEQDWIVNFKADIDQARTDAAKLESQLKETGDAGETAGDKVSSIGGSNKVNAVRDLTGPLGDVSSQVGDLGESFSAAGELIEEKMGLAAGSLTNFLGPLGIAAGAVFAFWNMYKARAEAAKKATMETAASIIDLGATAAAAKKVEDMLKTDPALVDNVLALGLKYQDLVDLMSGKTVPAFDAWRDLLGLVETAQLSQRGALGTYLPFIDAQAEKLGLTRDEFLKLLPAMKDVTGASGGQADQFAESRDIADKFADVMGRRLTPDMADLTVAADVSKQSLHDVQLELHGLDGSHAQADVTVTDNGTTAATGRAIDNMADQNRTAVVHISPDFGNFEARLAQATRNVTVTNVTIHAPTGMRAGDLVAAGDRYARRNGGRGARR